MWRPAASSLLALLAAWPAAAGTLAAKPERVVILKIDGLPFREIDKYAREPFGRTGRPHLPWIKHVFYENGARLENFYSRGLSISATSWTTLDTGRPAEIRGNVEYDRYTLRVHDYLNFFPFLVNYARSKRVDMPGVELLDDLGVTLMSDRFGFEQKFIGFQLLQRGVRWQTIPGTLKAKFIERSAREVFNEWQTGMSLAEGFNARVETELLEALKNPRIKYLDYFSGEYDHLAHLTPDRVSQASELQKIDALVGRVWAGIRNSPLADHTLFVLLSDHGINSVQGVFSQSYSLVDWFNGAEAGGHHVLTNRHPMTQFKLKGLDPFVTEVITPSSNSPYLSGEHTTYPTVLLDLDGNERASVYLRNSRLNLLHVLLDQIFRKKLPGAIRAAAIDAFLRERDAVRADWSRNLKELNEELVALRAEIARLDSLVASQPSKFSKQQRDHGLDKDARRNQARLEMLKAEQAGYVDYARSIERLLALQPADFEPAKFRMTDYIPRRAMGERNTFEDLRQYVTGPAAGGLVLSTEGSLDMERSFRRVDHLALLTAISVRNNVQRDVPPKPVDFVAVRAGESAARLWGGADRDAELQWRRELDGQLSIRYLPAGGWRFGLPLELVEDLNLTIPGDQREAWLSEWHTEVEWLRATHKSQYSTGVTGLAAHFEQRDVPSGNDLLSRYRTRKRALREPDMVIFARNHWNFNVRNFNPGGNHGSFLRPSTHTVLMLAGAGVPAGLAITEPYDGLSFAPTILKLMGQPTEGMRGRVIAELLSSQ